LSQVGIRLLFQRVRRQFGERVVLHDLDLEVAPGEFVAVVGRSGSGKSTLLRLAAGLDAPDGGAVLADGRPLAGLNRSARVMFQDARLLPWRGVRDNVGLGLTGDWRPAAEAMLERVGLGGRGGDWPAVLSGGQRQRAALARALVSDPRLLLLDEPLGSLDALTRIEMQRLVEQLWEQAGFTAVLITHDVEEAVALADRVLLLEGGRIGLERAVSLPRPRPRTHPQFAAAVEQILGRLLEEI
jgi:sulfonate transport system ATP-binding protein